MTSTEQQLAKQRAVAVNAGNLTIDHGASDLEIFLKPYREIGKPAEYVSVPRHQLCPCRPPIRALTYSIHYVEADDAARCTQLWPPGCWHRIEERFCEITAMRLSQDLLQFGELSEGIDGALGKGTERSS
jgi:hypothetical protein